MKITVLPGGDPWASHVLNHKKAYVETLSDVPVVATVLMEHVSFVHQGPERNFRPFLHLQGEVTDLVAPDVELPYGIEGMSFEPDHGARMDASYDFDNQQLTALVAKGYFEQGFRVPEEMTGVAWELPMQARIILVSPEDLDSPPLVFVDIAHIDDLSFDERTSGYELAAYFPNLAAQREQPEDSIERPELPDYLVEDLDVSRDLFAEEGARDQVENLPAQESTVDAEQGVRSEIEERYQREVMDRLAREARAAKEAELAALREAREAAGAGVGRERTDEGVEQGGILLFEEGFMAFEPDDGAFDGDGELLFELDESLFEPDVEAQIERDQRHDDVARLTTEQVELQAREALSDQVPSSSTHPLARASRTGRVAKGGVISGVPGLADTDSARDGGEDELDLELL